MIHALSLCGLYFALCGVICMILASALGKRGNPAGWTGLICIVTAWGLLLASILPR